MSTDHDLTNASHAHKKELRRENAARFILEKVFKRTRYTGATVNELASALDLVANYLGPNPNGTTTKVLERNARDKA